MFLFACAEPDITRESMVHDTDSPVAETTREVRVRVTRDGEPAAGVTVLQGGNPERWTTDAAGDASITVDLAVVGDLYVMASAPDARIGGTFVEESDDLLVELVRFDPADNEAYVYASPGEGEPIRTTSEVCLHCHVSTHTEWWASPHRTSASNPVLYDLYQGTAQLGEEDCGGSFGFVLQPGLGAYQRRCVVAGGVEGSGDCADCHAPGIDGRPGGRDLLDAVGVAYQYGIHCDVCHHVESVDLTKPPGVAGALHIVRPSEPSSSPVFGTWSPLTFGPWDDVPNPRMGAVAREVFHESTFCAGCHESSQPAADPSRWPDGIPVHSTYAEWLAGPMNPAAPCQSCHMPPDPTQGSGAGLYTEGADDSVGIAMGWERPPGSVRKHTFYGPRQPDAGFLQLAATLDVEVGAEVRVTVKNAGPGHALPTGEPMRAMLLTVEATCEGAPAALSGPALPDWAGWLDRRESDWEQWPGAEVGDVLHVARRGGYLDYEGFGPFGDGTFSVEEKGLVELVHVGSATIVAVDGDAVTLSEPLPEGDIVWRTRGQALAGAPGHAFARVMADAAGNEMVPHFQAVDVASDNRLLPQRSWTGTWAAPCATPVVTATLLHRNYPYALATERAWTVTDQVMATVTR